MPENKEAYGALPSDWDTIERLGLVGESLPCVMNPGAEVSQLSTLKGLGKTPSLYNREGYVAGIVDWAQKTTHPSRFAIWRKELDYGICLQSRTVHAFDIDVPESEKARKILATIDMVLGRKLPVRSRPNSGKILVAYRLPGSERRKSTLKVDGGIIEHLANGQQFIFAGTNQGARIEWDWRGNEDFPVLTYAEEKLVRDILEMEHGLDGAVWSDERGARRKQRVEGQNVDASGAESNDPVMIYLTELGHVLEYGSEGQAHIECPFSDQHTTDSAISSTSYFPAKTGGYEQGHFVCLHAHCAERGDEEFLDAFGYRVAQFEDISSEPNNGEAENDSHLPGVLGRNSSEIAYKFLAQRHTVGGEPSLLRCAGEWFEYGAGRFAAVERECLRGGLRRYLDQAFKRTAATKQYPQGRVVPFDPTDKHITEVESALTAVPAVYQKPGGFPRWKGLPPFRDGAEVRPEDVLCLRDGLLLLRNRELIPHTPNFVTTNALPYAWGGDNANDSQLDAPHWLEFLRSVWPDDQESIDALQEWLGYLLTTGTGHQKMLLIQGPKRSGKGTIARVLKELIGEENYVGPTLEFIGKQFGLAPLIGKQVAVFPDARIGHSQHKHEIVEALLAISGEDNLTIDRKNKDSWTGRIKTRFVMLTNELPELGDASGAFASRFIILKMTKSFYGKEDEGLLDRLLPELPGILRWALTGLDRLNRRGRFVQPESGKATVRQLEHYNSPVLAFLHDCCEIGTEYSTDKQTLYTAYTEWCSRQGRKYPTHLARFSEDLMAADGSISSFRPRIKGGSRGSGGGKRVFRGVKLIPEALD